MMRSLAVTSGPRSAQFALPRTGSDNTHNDDDHQIMQAHRGKLYEEAAFFIRECGAFWSYQASDCPARNALDGAWLCNNRHEWAIAVAEAIDALRRDLVAGFEVEPAAH